MIVHATYVSVWDGDVKIRTDCLWDTDKRVAFDIQSVGVSGVEQLSQEYVELPGGETILVDSQVESEEGSPAKEVGDSLAAPYVLAEQDEQELTVVRERLAALARRIAPLERNQPGADLRDSFPLGTGGPRRGGRRQSRKRFDASFEKARKLVPLYEERSRLQAQERAILSGARQAEREQAARRERRRLASATRVRAARVGDYVQDSAYGTVRVVRVNAHSLTIETEAGSREPRKFSLIRDVAFTEAQIIDWFAKRDASGAFPIRPFVRAALAGDGSVAETAAWLRVETQQRYPSFIRNLPWQTIAHYFHEDERRRLSEAGEAGQVLGREGG